MDCTKSQSIFVPDDVLESLYIASGFSALNKALEHLIETAKTSDGQSELASKGILAWVLKLCKSPCQLSGQDLLLSVKLLRNLCAGEIRNQNLFMQLNGVGVLWVIIKSMGLTSGYDNCLLRTLLQTLGNVSLAGEQHQVAVWNQLFPSGFLDIARVRSKETCDPLCMIIYTCSEGTNERYTELLSDSGLDIIIEIVRTVTVGKILTVCLF